MADTESKSVAECKEESEKHDDSMKNYEFDGQTYIYTDKATNITYKYDQENNKWVVKEDKDKKSTDNTESSDNKNSEGTKSTGPAGVGATGVFGFENDTHTYTDSNDGSVYFWDKEKNAWFPKVDEDFMARYQMNYGFNDTSASQPKPPEPMSQPPPPQKTSKEEKEQRKAEAKRKAQEPPTWFEVDEAHNTAIYVSGLPLDITMEELTQLFTKCGLIARDERGKDKIKLYKDSNGEPKGDALCTYIKVSRYEFELGFLFTIYLLDFTVGVQFDVTDSAAKIRISAFY